MKLKTFPVSGIQNEVLNWSMGLFLAFSAVDLIDHWTAAPNEGQSLFVEAFASMRSHTGIQIAEAVLLLATKLAMWEALRRGLKKTNHFFLQLGVILLMLLDTFMTVASCLPSTVMGTDGNTVHAVCQSTAHLLTQFYLSCYTVSFLIQATLGIGLATVFAGRIRWYGASLLLCPLLTSILNMGYLYIYNNVGGVSMPDIIKYGTIVSLAGFSLDLIPFILLRRSMCAEEG